MSRILLPLFAARPLTGLVCGLCLPWLLSCTLNAAPGDRRLPRPTPASPPAARTSPTGPPTATRQVPMLSPLQPGQSGIQGQVLQQSGNFMPQIQPPNQAAIPARNQTEPIQTRIWVFSGRLPAQGTRWPVAVAQSHPQLLGRLTSNPQGEFSAQLPPGEYTVFAQYGDDLYLNAFQGDGSYATVQVQSGTPTELRLVNSEQAAF